MYYMKIILSVSMNTYGDIIETPQRTFKMSSFMKSKEMIINYKIVANNTIRNQPENGDIIDATQSVFSTETISVTNQSVMQNQAFDRDSKFISRPVKILQPIGEQDHHEHEVDIFFPIPPTNPTLGDHIKKKLNQLESLKNKASESKKRAAQYKLAALLPCVYPFDITEEQMTAFDTFMEPFWKYNNMTAKGLINKNLMLEINKIINRYLVEDDNRIPLDVNELALCSIDLTEIKSVNQSKSKDIILDEKHFSNIESKQSHELLLLKEVIQLATEIKKGLPVGYENRKELKRHLTEFFDACAEEKFTSQNDSYNFKSRVGSVAGKVMISGLSFILGIDEDSFDLKTEGILIESPFYETGIRQKLLELLRYMDEVCIHFNELVSKYKEIRFEKSPSPWDARGHSYQEWKWQQKVNYYRSLKSFYILKSELKEAVEKMVENKHSHENAQLTIKHYVNIIEGAVIGVQIWSAFITNRYHPNLKSLDINTIYNDLINEQSTSYSLEEFNQLVSNEMVPALNEKISEIKSNRLNLLMEDIDLKNDFNRYVELECSNYPNSPNREITNLDRNISKQVNLFLESKDQNILLIQGNTGSGKSLFLRLKEHELWTDYSTGKIIPIHIRLSHYKNPGNCILDFLTQIKCSKDVITELKKQPVLFLLDGFDENRSSQELLNFYESNQLQLWTKAKVIITCRSQFLTGKNYLNQFSKKTSFNMQERSQRLTEIFILPFSKHQIKQYLKLYVKFKSVRQSKDILSVEEYEATLSKLSVANEMMNDPLTLRMLLDIISNKKNTVGNKNLSRLTIYNEFFYDWFTEQYEFSDKKDLDDLSLNHYEFHDLLKTFNSDLAYKMFLNDNQIAYRGDIKWKQIFSGNSKDERKEKHLAFKGSPLKKIADEMYRPSKYDEVMFIHKSFQEYFIAQHILKYLINNEIFESTDDNHPINKKLFTREHGIIQFFVDSLKEQDNLDSDIDSNKLKAMLFNWVLKSKPEDGQKVSTGAANAITILNAASVSMSGENFKGIKIPHANLDYAILDHADCSDALLSNVSFKKAQLNNVKFENSNMANVEFGEGASLNFNYKLMTLKIFNDSAFIGDENGYLYEINVDTLKKYSINNIRLNSLQITDDRTEKNISALNYTQNPRRIWIGNEKEGAYCIKITKEHQLFDFKRLLKTSVTKIVTNQTETCIAFGGTDNIVSIFNKNHNGGFKLYRKHEFSDPIRSLSFIGEQCIVGLQDGTISRIENTELFTQKVHEDWVNGIVYSKKFNRLITVSGDKSLAFLDPDTFEVNQRLFGHTSQIYAVSMHPNEHQIATVGKDMEVRIWDVFTGECITVLSGHKGVINDISYDSTGNQLVTVSNDKTIRFWDSNQIITRKQGHTRSIVKFHFSNDASQLISIGIDGMFRWSIKSGECKTHNYQHDQGIKSIALTSDESILAKGEKGKLTLCDFQTMEVSKEITTSDQSVWSLDFSPNNKLIAIGLEIEDNKQKVELRQTSSPDAIYHEFETSSLKKWTVAFSKNSQWFAFGNDTGQIIIFDCVNKTTLQTFHAHNNDITNLKFDKTGTILISTSLDKTLKVWNKNDEGTFSLKHQMMRNVPISVATLATSQSNLKLITGLINGKIEIFNFNDLTLEISFNAHCDSITCFEIDKDRNVLFSGSRDRTIRAWDLNYDSNKGFLKTFWLAGESRLTLKDANITNIQNLSSANGQLLGIQ